MNHLTTPWTSFEHCLPSCYHSKSQLRPLSRAHNMATQTSAVSAPYPASTKLEDQAATAALYVTKHGRNKSSNGNRFMDGDRLSPASMTLYKSFHTAPLTPHARCCRVSEICQPKGPPKLSLHGAEKGRLSGWRGGESRLGESKVI